MSSDRVKVLAFYMEYGGAFEIIEEHRNWPANLELEAEGLIEFGEPKRYSCSCHTWYPVRVTEIGHVFSLFPTSLDPDMVIDFNQLPEPGSISDALAGIMTAVTEAGKRVAIVTGTDYGTIEMHILATMHHESARGIVLDLGSRGGEIPGAFDLAALMPAIRPKQPATKQNGRSASYLSHDPTKNHGRRRG